MGVAIQLWQRSRAKQYTVDYFPNRSMEHGGLSTQTYMVAKRTKAAASTDSDKKPTSVATSLADRVVPSGTSAKLTIAAAQNLSGKATIYDGTTKLRTITIVKGETKTVTLPKTLAVGKHSIRVRFEPKNKKRQQSAVSSATLTVTE